MERDVWDGWRGGKGERGLKNIYGLFFCGDKNSNVQRIQTSKLPKELEHNNTRKNRFEISCI
jgi:hypothetical protein